MDQEFRDKICGILNENGQYAVVWNGHFGRKFIVKKPDSVGNRTRIGEIYSAIYEEYFDKYGEDDEVGVFEIGYKDNSWKYVFGLIENRLKINLITEDNL